MTAMEQGGWQEANQRYLTAALGVVRETLERHAAAGEEDSGAGPRQPAAAPELLAAAADRMPAPPALEVLCSSFGLTGFEHDVLLLCAGVELEASFAAACAAAAGDPQRTRPTFGLALAALPEAHWSALTPGGALRRWRLIEVGAGDGLTSGALRLDERVLHYLAGLNVPDEHLEGFVRPVAAETEEAVPSHRALAEAVASVWERENGPASVIQLVGDEGAAKRRVAVAAAARIGHGLQVLAAEVLPQAPHDLDVLMRLWEREAALGRSALLVDCGGLGKDDAASLRRAARFLEGTGGPLLVAGRERLRLEHRPAVTFEVGKPSAGEQRELWLEALGSEAPANGAVERLVSHFDLGAPAIRALSRQALTTNGDSSEALDARLWAACRSRARPRLGDLAQRLEPVATWRDIVLPAPQLEILREAAVHVRHRATVYQRWGFAAKSARGLGISALFTGPSGTGKTMASEVLANELELDLYRIDLSQVVSKYIGETEKNLSRVFDAAEEGGAILLFDEADALFGKRGEVKDSHDRYANIEVSYLLQRMESYRGLAILTTNMKEALDDAFLRRIRFVVTFPFPGASLRAEIWRRIFPVDTPTRGLDAGKLGRLNVAGGNIRNIAMNAAFRAADAGEPVSMNHLLTAARGEYAKLEKPLTGAEIGGWV